MSTEEMLDALPEKIVLHNDSPIDEWDDEKHDERYMFDLVKDRGAYEFSYICWSKEIELISFRGSLQEVASSMYEWCKEKGYV